MQFNVIVDVVIGLVVLFWMVATSASFVVEALSSTINIRGKVLEIYVREMILGGAVAKSLRDQLKWFGKQLLPERPQAAAAAGGAAEADSLNVSDHPLIRRLAKPEAGVKGQDTAPSYIPSDLFAKALIDRLRQVYGALLTMREVQAALRPQFPQLAAAAAALRDWQADTAAGGQLLQTLFTQVAAAPGALAGIDTALKTLLPESTAARVLKVLRDHIAAGGFNAAALWQELAPVLADRGALGISDLQAIVNSGRLPASLSAAMKPLLDNANHDIADFRQQFAGWYDSVMDRASGWFRRYTQRWLFAVALLMAVCLNLDVIYIGQRLVADRAARDAAVRLGQTVVTEGDRADALPQQYRFLQHHKDGLWAEPLLKGEHTHEAAQAAARQLQLLLPVSGSYVGPMLALQGALLAMDRRCPEGQAEPACSSGHEFAKEWEALKDNRTALAAAMCRQSANKGSTAQRERAGTLGQDALLADAKTMCPDLPKDLDTPLKTAKDARERLLGWWTWGDDKDKFSWNAPLARAALEMQFKTGEVEVQARRNQALRDAVKTALDKAAKKLQAADDLLARMPYVGSTQGFIDRWWKDSEQHGLCWVWGLLLNIAGWLITALMASLGAPTWFDLLNKLVNRRNTGPKPEPAGDSAGAG